MKTRLREYERGEEFTTVVRDGWLIDLRKDDSIGEGYAATKIKMEKDMTVVLFEKPVKEQESNESTCQIG